MWWQRQSLVSVGSHIWWNSVVILCIVGYVDDVFVVYMLRSNGFRILLLDNILKALDKGMSSGGKLPWSIASSDSKIFIGLGIVARLHFFKFLVIIYSLKYLREVRDQQEQVLFLWGGCLTFETKLVRKGSFFGCNSGLPKRFIIIFIIIIIIISFLAKKKESSRV